MDGWMGGWVGESDISESLDSGIIVLSPSSSALTYAHIFGSFLSVGCAIISRAVQDPSSLSLACTLFSPGRT